MKQGTLIRINVREPQVLTAFAPQELFIDPSLTYRLWLHNYRPAREPVRTRVYGQAPMVHPMGVLVGLLNDGTAFPMAAIIAVAATFSLIAVGTITKVPTFSC